MKSPELSTARLGGFVFRPVVVGAARVDRDLQVLPLNVDDWREKVALPSLGLGVRHMASTKPLGFMARTSMTSGTASEAELHPAVGEYLA